MGNVVEAAGRHPDLTTPSSAYALGSLAVDGKRYDGDRAGGVLEEPDRH